MVRVKQDGWKRKQNLITWNLDEIEYLMPRPHLKKIFNVACENEVCRPLD